MRPSLPKGEPDMDTGDWRTQFSPNSRQKIVKKIMEILKKHLPFSGPEGINELSRIAVTFEERIFSVAHNQTEYLRKISMRMLTMEAKSPNAAAASSLSPAATHILPLNPGHHPMKNDNSKHSLVKGEPVVINTCDWRTQLTPDSRRTNANKIMETLKNNVPNVGQERINELMRIAVSFEELIFNTAFNQVDYFRKLSFKMLTMEDDNSFSLRHGQCSLKLSGKSQVTMKYT